MPPNKVLSVMAGLAGVLLIGVFLMLIFALGVDAYANLEQQSINQEYANYLMHSPCGRPADVDPGGVG